jgi:hypothetical protein
VGHLEVEVEEVNVSEYKFLCAQQDFGVDTIEKYKATILAPLGVYLQIAISVATTLLL